MADVYNVGDRLYLPVWIIAKESDIVVRRDNNEVRTDTKFAYAYWHGETRRGEVRYGEPGLLLTAEEVAQEVNTERDDALAELKARNAELEALLKEVIATRDEAIQQNNELIAENEHQKSACEEQKRLAQNWKENAYKLDKEKEELFDAKERLDAAKEAITFLQQENSSLKSKLEDAEVMCGNAVDTSRKRQQKIATMEEVIVSLVEKIRRLEGDD